MLLVEFNEIMNKLLQLKKDNGLIKANLVWKLLEIQNSRKSELKIDKTRKSRKIYCDLRLTTNV